MFKFWLVQLLGRSSPPRASLRPALFLLNSTASFSMATNATSTKEYDVDVCIIGSGPAAHTAGIYASRANLNVLLFEGMFANEVAPGGQLTTTTDVENFPGFPEGVLGYDLTELFKQQSTKFGTKVLTETVDRVDMSVRPFKIYTKKSEVTAKVVIVATGAVAKRLHFEGSETFWTKGISACAVCDGAFFKDRVVAVVGGGDTAMEEGNFLTKYASKVYVVHRRDSFRASKIMQDRVMKNPKIEVLWNKEITAAYGTKTMESMKIKDTVTGEETTMPCQGIFFAIGHTPASAFLGGQLTMDETGYVITHPDSTATNVPGVFAAGDVQDKKFRQAITAAGSGCMAGIEAEHFIEALASGDAH